MQKKRSKRRMRAQLAFVYTVMALAVVSIVAVLILVVQGYRYNRYDGKVEQGGLVQFDSRPAGATVVVDGTMLANKTASKITLSAGKHTVMMTRDGYIAWKKDVIVKPGGVLWLNYTQLLPQNPSVTSVASYAGLSSTLSSPDHKLMAVIPVAATPEILLTTLATDTPVTTRLTFPTGSYTVSADPATQRFSLIGWDKDSHLLIIRHMMAEKTEYLVTDIRDTKTRNITSLSGLEMAKVMFSLSDSNQAYILSTSHELRRINLSDATMSTVLASGVEDVVADAQGGAEMTTFADADGVRSVSYLSSGSLKAKVLKSYHLSAGDTLHVATGTYYGDHYTAVFAGTTLEVLRGNLPNSESSAAIQLTSVLKTTIATGADAIGFSPHDNRMIYAVRGTALTTYDLELAMLSHVTLASAPPSDLVDQVMITPGLEWFDSYHIMTSGGSAYLYDYDGTNPHPYATATAPHSAVLADGEKYLYYFTGTDATAKLVRIKLTPN